MINVLLPIIWICFIQIILFRHVCCSGDYSKRVSDIYTPSNVCPTKQTSDRCTRSHTPQSRTHLPTFISTSEVYRNIELIDNIWKGQLSPTFNIEVAWMHPDTLMLYVYSHNSSHVFRHQSQLSKKAIPSDYKISLVTEPKVQVDIKNTTNNSTICCITIPTLSCSNQMVMHVHYKVQSVFPVTSTENQTYFVRQIWSLLETNKNKTSLQSRKRTDKDPGRFYNYNDGSILPEVDYTSNVTYICGGYIIPLYDCCILSDTRNKIGLIITLDGNGRAEGDIKIKISDHANSDGTEYYVHLKVRVDEGNYLRINVVESDKVHESLFLDNIRFYGLYGFPNSFTIDKGKTYEIENDMSDHKRITNYSSKKGIITFSQLRMNLRTAHLLTWRYF